VDGVRHGAYIAPEWWPDAGTCRREAARAAAARGAVRCGERIVPPWTCRSVARGRCSPEESLRPVRAARRCSLSAHRRSLTLADARHDDVDVRLGPDGRRRGGHGAPPAGCYVVRAGLRRGRGMRRYMTAVYLRPPPPSKSPCLSPLSLFFLPSNTNPKDARRRPRLPPPPPRCPPGHPRRQRHVHAGTCVADVEWAVAVGVLCRECGDCMGDGRAATGSGLARGR
jgi:hypothetical protein